MTSCERDCASRKSGVVHTPRSLSSPPASHPHNQPHSTQDGRPRSVAPFAAFDPRVARSANNNCNAVKEIPAIIHLLTQSPPSLQRATIEKYFTPDAAFSHPFCRTWSRPNSRWLVQATYRWYKIMSPRIDLTVQSVGMYGLVLFYRQPPQQK
jgi:hypothetical protein